jgi:hypothetical protein
MTRSEILSLPCKFLSREQKTAYFDQGYVCLAGAIPRSWIERLRAAADAIVEQAVI